MLIDQRLTNFWPTLTIDGFVGVSQMLVDQYTQLQK